MYALLACWYCTSLNSGPAAVAIWDNGPEHGKYGLCLDCLNRSLDKADDGEFDEPARLGFLVPPDQLMTRETLWT